MGISYDSAETTARVAEKLGVTFPLLSDPESLTIDAYRVRNASAHGRTAGIPHPTVFLIDAEGVIRAVLRHQGYRERHGSADLIEAARELD